jgi:hypothetical protein
LITLAFTSGTACAEHVRVRTLVAISLAALVGGCGSDEGPQDFAHWQNGDCPPEFFILAGPCDPVGYSCTDARSQHCVCQEGCYGFGWDHPVLCCMPDDMGVPVVRDMSIVPHDLSAPISEGGAGD